MKTNCIYFAEGKCEVQLLEALKEQPSKIMPGKVKTFNVVANRIPNSVIIDIKAGSTVVFVFDTDVEITQTLKNNIELVKKHSRKTRLVFLPQVLNLEDELVRCTDIKTIAELTRSKTTKEFKRDFCALTNCREVLNRHQLDVLKLWTTKPPEAFSFVTANCSLIKL